MKEYLFSENAAKQTLKSQMISRIPMILISVICGLYIANSQNNGVVFGNGLVLSMTLLTIGIAVIIGLLIGIKNGTKVLMQNKYLLSDISIERQAPSGKSIKLDFEKIDKYQKLKKGLFLKSNKDKILIPSTLDEYEELSSKILAKLK